MKPTTRDNHLHWCKLRAQQELQDGTPRMAVAGMLSDLGMHPETASHMGRWMGVMLLMSGALETVTQVQKFIEGLK